MTVKPFKIITDNETPQYLSVYVGDMHIQIKQDDEGVAVDIWDDVTEYEADSEPDASTWSLYKETDEGE